MQMPRLGLRMTQALVLALAVSCGEASDIGVPSADGSLDDGWRAFRAQVVESSSRPGVFIVEGDIAIHGEAALRKYYQERMTRVSQPLTVRLTPSGDDVWPEASKHALTYCVSPGFLGTKRETVRVAMAQAAESWSRRVGVTIRHDASADLDCDNVEAGSFGMVTFEVRPALATDRFIARAFFPSDPAYDRIVWIHSDAFTPATANNHTLEEVLRHELGHVMGFRHEHIWISPVSGQDTCKSEDSGQPGHQDDARQLVGGYDVLSIMHYAQCRPAGSSWAYAQTETDYRAAISLYGLAPSLIVGAVTAL
ncbi:M57 family metalloprotease [Myxococcus stipitatus]|uniref:M57 family metalloprotease n=1 Tax=Myxococcus stipitatus TaxID=83455 RepID=UPI0030CABDB4